MKNIVVITGTRADYGLLKPVIEAINKISNLRLQLLVTGMHTLKKYGQTLNEIKKDKIKIASIISVSENDDMLSSLAKEILGIKKYCQKNKVDLIVLLGDRHEQLAGAIVAGHLNIPIAHIHGGDATAGVIDDSVRHAITKFSHLHFTVSEFSQERVVKLGEENWRVFNTGSPGLDSLEKINYLNRSQLAEMLKLKEKERWFLVLQHPAFLEETEIKKQFVGTLAAVNNFSGEKIIIYPNSDTGSQIFINEIEKLRKKKDVKIFKSLSRQIYVSLLKEVEVLVGNSSSGMIEAGYFKLPVVNIGERQFGREHGKNVLDLNYNEREIEQAIRKALSQKFKQICKNSHHPYGSGGTGEQIIKIISKMLNKKELLQKRFTYVNK
jgi:UDP-N-acetylglucosamine 2-epimerase (non-hydrolysing)/GDP/UDP-N,N'-diacetylbacillosamine 2-epimerase (hydrolysing)